MDSSSIQVILLAVIGIFGGKEVWQYLTARATAKEAAKSKDSEGETQLHKEIRSMFETNITNLTLQSKMLEEKLVKIELERDQCKSELSESSVRIAVLTERLLKYSMHTRGGKKSE